VQLATLVDRDELKELQLVYQLRRRTSGQHSAEGVCLSSLVDLRRDRSDSRVSEVKLPLERFDLGK
jgi:hypothetical protein